MLLVCVAGFVTCSLQVMCWIVLRPLSKRLFRSVTSKLLMANWLPLVAVFEKNVKLTVHGSEEDWQLMREESKFIVLPNHPGGADWLTGWSLLHHIGKLGSAKSVVKDSLRYVPVCGWSLALSPGYIFLKRNYEKDKALLQQGFRSLEKMGPSESWVFAIFPEGTRLAPNKLKESQEYAKKAGLPVLEHVLLPRKRGFVDTVQGLRSSVRAVYDITISHPCPNVLDVLTGDGSAARVSIEIRRHAIEELPENDAALAEWLMQNFVAKDAALKHFKAHGRFAAPVIDIPPRQSSVIFLAFWSLVVLLFGAWLAAQVVAGSARWTYLSCGLVALVVVMTAVSLQMAKTGDTEKKKNN